MSLSSAQLEAFAQVARTRNFSAAAKALHITQSALSQRIINLERELGVVLIVRDPAGLRLTPSGEELLRYCVIKDEIEAEVLGRITGEASQMVGTVRIGGFSSVMRSIVMPCLSPLITENPGLRVELFSRELYELIPMLTSSATDFILTMSPIEKDAIECVLLGYEENVLTESAARKTPRDVFYDHDPEDQTTELFFKNQAKAARPQTLKRCFVDEVYAIINAVESGWGRAVLPKHLIKGNSQIKEVPGFKPLLLPVYLSYFRQPYYSRLNRSVLDTLTLEMPRYLTPAK